MEIDRTRDKALLETNTSDFKRFWSLLPNTGNGAKILMSQATNSRSRACLWPFCLLASHQLPLFPLSCPPSNAALFPAQSGEVSSWILLYFLGSVWHSLVPGALSCCSCNSSPPKHRQLGTRSQSSVSLQLPPLFGEPEWVWIPCKQTCSARKSSRKLWSWTLSER